MEPHQQQGRGMLWSDAPPLRHRASPDNTFNSARPRSVVVVDPMPPQTAPLWRNAPNHHAPTMAPLSAPSPPRRTTPPAVSFQQSLRSYPSLSKNSASVAGKFTSPTSSLYNQRQNSQPRFDNSARRLGPTSTSRRLPQSKTVHTLSSVGKGNDKTQAQQPRCHVTNLEGESSTPFFLDYLDSQSAMIVADPLQAAPIGAFNHRQFMEMFRSEPSEQSGAHPRETDLGTETGNGNTADLGSLPYAVNTESAENAPFVLTPNSRFSAFDSLVSNASDQQYDSQNCAYSRPTPNLEKVVMRRRSAPRAALSATAVGHGKEPVVFRKPPSKAMDNKNSQSSSNISQRLQIAAERRTQIEEARRERVQRQIEQSPRPTTAAANMSSSHHFSQNPSVAFGSTRPRNIDLTKPLVTPLPNARPKSEIFSSGTSSYYAGANAGNSVVDSPVSSGHVFSKDDTNYQVAARTPRTPVQPQHSTTPSLMSQSMIVTSSSGNNSSYRAVRRHDPELVPAMQKYIFREYAMPTSASGTPSLRKENSMISSMMSTKSFQANNATSPFYRTPFGGPQNRPKKSYSMNRLDQLAQPRRRVEPKVPTSASFVRPKIEPITSSFKKPVSATESGEGRVKPIPPPKTLFKSPKAQSNESGNTSSSTPLVPSRNNRPATTPKPRPLSQIELSTTQSASASDEAAAVEGGEKEFEGSDADRLAEYKRALAEKRAMFRKQQEEQQQTAPVRKAKIVKPEPAPVTEAESEEQKKEASLSSSSSSSSSSESDNEADNEDEEDQQRKSKQQKKVTIAAPLALADELAQASEIKKEEGQTPSASIDTVTSGDAPNEQLISFGPSSSSSDQLPSHRNVSDLMSTSLTGDLANLSISSNEMTATEKALAAASMTASFDSSQLTSNSSVEGANGGNQRKTSSSKTLTKEQLEERSAILLQQQMAEREKRKSRVQEILKRTRKDEKEKKEGQKPTSSNSNGDSSNSENEANNGNNSDEATNGNANGVDDESSKFNGLNGESSGKSTENHSNGHLGSNHHRDMKTFVSENEQSLPPTNGF